MARSSSTKRQKRVQGVRAPGAVLQAMLQGTLQGAGPVSYCYKVLTRCFVLGVLFPGPRSYPCLWMFCLGHFVPDSRSWILVFGCFVLGVLFLDPRSWIFILGILSWVFCSWIIILGVPVLDSARTGRCGH